MAKQRINTEKLAADYKADQERLESRVATAEDEIRATLAPYLSVGTFNEQDVKPLADKLVAAEKAEFDRKWAPLADYIEDDEPAVKECVIPSYDPADDLEQPAIVDVDDDEPGEQDAEPHKIDTVIY